LYFSGVKGETLSTIVGDPSFDGSLDHSAVEGGVGDPDVLGEVGIHPSTQDLIGPDDHIGPTLHQGTVVYLQLEFLELIEKQGVPDLGGLVLVEGALLVADVDVLEVEALLHGGDDHLHPVGSEVTEGVTKGVGEVLGGEVEGLLTLVVVTIFLEHLQVFGETLGIQGDELQEGVVVESGLRL
jgi:hypothetical protein